MQAYIIRRILIMIPTLVGVAAVIFLVMRVAPGDVAQLILAGRGDTAAIREEDVEAVRERLGLDRPLIIQFGVWMGEVVRFDFGKSLWTRESVLVEVGRKFPISLEIALLATLLSSVISIPAGIITALRQDGWPDYLIRTISIIGLSMPTFWSGILILLILVQFFNWSPPLEYTPFYRGVKANMEMLIWPILVLAYFNGAIILRMTRSTMLEVLREDYVRTAWAKGLRERVIMLRHALPNSLLPVITIMGMNFAVLIGGLVVTETVFNVPGLGSFMAESVIRRDYPMVQGMVLMMAAVVLLVNFMVDISYGWLDPRIRYQ